MENNPGIHPLSTINNIYNQTATIENKLVSSPLSNPNHENYKLIRDILHEINNNKNCGPAEVIAFIKGGSLESIFQEDTSQIETFKNKYQDILESEPSSLFNPKTVTILRSDIAKSLQNICNLNNPNEELSTGKKQEIVDILLNRYKQESHEKPTWNIQVPEKSQTSEPATQRNELERSQVLAHNFQIYDDEIGCDKIELNLDDCETLTSNGDIVKDAVILAHGQNISFEKFKYYTQNGNMIKNATITNPYNKTITLTDFESIINNGCTLSNSTIDFGTAIASIDTLYKATSNGCSIQGNIPISISLKSIFLKIIEKNHSTELITDIYAKGYKVITDEITPINQENFLALVEIIKSANSLSYADAINILNCIEKNTISLRDLSKYISDPINCVFKNLTKFQILVVEKYILANEISYVNDKKQLKISNYQFENFDFSKAQTNFSKARTELKNIIFEKCTFISCDFSSIDLCNTIFQDCKINRYVIFKDTRWMPNDFYEIVVKNKCFIGSQNATLETELRNEGGKRIPTTINWENFCQIWGLYKFRICGAHIIAHGQNVSYDTLKNLKENYCTIEGAIFSKELGIVVDKEIMKYAILNKCTIEPGIEVGIDYYTSRGFSNGLSALILLSLSEIEEFEKFSIIIKNALIDVKGKELNLDEYIRFRSKGYRVRNAVILASGQNISFENFKSYTDNTKIWDISDNNKIKNANIINTTNEIISLTDFLTIIDNECTLVGSTIAVGQKAIKINDFAQIISNKCHTLEKESLKISLESVIAWENSTSELILEVYTDGGTIFYENNPVEKDNVIACMEITKTANKKSLIDEDIDIILQFIRDGTISNDFFKYNHEPYNCNFDTFIKGKIDSKDNNFTLFKCTDTITIPCNDFLKYTSPPYNFVFKNFKIYKDSIVEAALERFRGISKTLVEEAVAEIKDLESKVKSLTDSDKLRLDNLKSKLKQLAGLPEINQYILNNFINATIQSIYAHDPDSEDESQSD